ncbi:MAG: MFS transporter, partial [Clostridia bacterium]|nr:MFS transporter [Clostridia bacterium]
MNNASAIENNVRPFGWRDKIGYLLGNVGNDFTFAFAGVFLLVFYTKVLGIPSELVGTMFLLARFLDAFTDITMGRIVDIGRGGKNGKFRPWLLRMSAPVAIASFLMYQSSLADASMGLKIAYMFVTYLVWGSVFYTAVNIPYGSMASVLSTEADDRAALSTFRSVGSVFANIAVGVIAPLLIYTSDSAGNQIVRSGMFPRVAAVFSLIAFVCYLFCYSLTVERVKPDVNLRKEKKLSAGETARALVTDRALVGIVIASVCVLAAQLLNQAINQYLFIDYFRDKSGIMIMSVAAMLPGLVLAPFAVPLSRRFGKKEIGVFGSFCGAISCFLLFFLKTRSMWLYITVNVLGFLGFGIFNLIMWAFITDIIDDRQVRTGAREDGTVYAVYSFARKVGQAIAGGLGGWALG